MEEAKHTILSQALSQDARARCKQLIFIYNINSYLIIVIIFFYYSLLTEPPHNLWPIWRNH